MRTYLGLFLLSALIAQVTTPRVRALGRRLRAYAPRDSGGPPVPRLGGLAVLAAALAALAALLAVPNELRARLLLEAPIGAALLAPSLLVLLLGVYDDLRGTSASQKLAVQSAAAALAWYLGFRIHTLPLAGWAIDNAALSFFLTVVWIVVVTNAFNLIDGMDGLAAGIGFFVTLSVFAVSLLQGQFFVCLLTVSLAGALLGFLRFNAAPAQIFLGDTGSLFLGFFLGTLAIHTSQKSTTLVAIVVPFVAFGLPLLDTALSIVRRFLCGRPLFEADQDHTHHRLLRRLSPRAALLALYALAAFFSLGSLLILRSTGNLAALIAVLVGVSAWFLTSQLRYEELSELNLHVAGVLQNRRRTLANHITIRKAASAIAGARGPEEAWRVLSQTLEDLGFERAECRLGAAVSVAAGLPAMFNGLHGPAMATWMAALPLRAHGAVAGRLRLWRALDKGPLLFEFSSLAEVLVPAFEAQIESRMAARSRAKAAEPRFESKHETARAGSALA